MKTKHYLQLALTVFLCWAAIQKTQAQERLIGLGENARLTENIEQNSIIKTKAAALVLPFVDDFAKAGAYSPDANKWLNNYVFINNNYAINAPSVGVATFDALDSKGKLYAAAGSLTFSADTLTSREINLSYSQSDSIYLSFFFQPGGYGDMPESSDTLTLQFYSSNNEWVSVWSASANLKDSTITTKWNGASKSVKVTDLGTSFYRAQLKIEAINFLHPIFQFRFINYASISVNASAPGRSTNADHWNLDYVYLDKNRRATDLNLPDIVLAAPQMPLSAVWESIPATHLSSTDAINELFPEPTPLTLVYRNLGWGIKSVNRNFRIAPLYGTGSTLQLNGLSENIFDGQTINFEFKAPKYSFSTTEDSAAFEIKSYLVTDNDPSPFRTDLRYNDTTTYTQHFRDYYAYDDGSAENGYGLFGNNTANGKVAVQFQSYKTDSIRGVYMYFNRTIREANATAFFVTVWSDHNGSPDKVLYTGRVTKPVFKDSLNMYVAYKFAKPVHIEKGVKYYVGWTQITDAFLDIGFDRNRNHQNQNFFKIYNDWEPSVYEGSLMLRPIFARTDAKFPEDFEPSLPPVIEEVEKNAFIAYPNPVTNGRLHITQNNIQHTPISSNRIDIFDTMGRLVLSTSSANGTVDMSTLQTGIYIIRVWENNLPKGTKRVVITK